MEIKNLVKKIPFLYKPTIYIVNRRNLKKRATAYKRYGVEALKKFVDCMNANGYKYTLAFGSILGAIREHGFIKHDLDIDTFVWYEDFSPLLIEKLQEAGFTWLCSYSIDSDKYGREDTFQYNGVNIDVFYLYSAVNNYPYCCDFVWKKGMDKNKRIPRRIEIPISKKRRKTTFEGIEVYIPDNAEQICEFRYGPTYMIPDSNWHWDSSYNAIKEWSEMLGKTSFRIHPILRH